ncbi:DUF305 domain-containing protein [Mycobacterium sp.]|uniref:DUF305 domain-containing protein n=1 Tax=Mycobacterium sp. TaxID=1785 RepID=UPI003C75A1F8
MRIAAALAALLAVGMLTSCGYSSDQHDTRTGAQQTTEQADHNADDITFASNMVPHHEQAVVMAQLVPTNTTNQQIIDLANRIIGSQVPEIQAFRAFLMQWQDAEGNDASPGHDGAGHGAAMPGMVDQATIDKLRSLRNAEFDQLWLTSMIDHHRGAIAMAQDEIAHGKNPDVIYLAKSIITAQQAEIDQMKQMLGG